VIFLYTDFGADGPYLAQLEAAVLLHAPGEHVLSLVSNAPAADPFRAAYLIAALSAELPGRSTIVAVVDPGVGGTRSPVVVDAGGHRFVGPDNGLISRAAARDPEARAWRIDWRPDRLSDSFHGRDLFGPVAGRLAAGDPVALTALPVEALVGMDWPAGLAEVVYVDAYGNLCTGIPGAWLADDAVLEVGGRSTLHRRTFCEAARGEPFWCRNSCGLIEVAVNGGNARDLLGVGIGGVVAIRA
jgi:hypothetical protein